MRCNVRVPFAVACWLLAGGLLVAADEKEQAVQKERQKLEGTWEVESIENDGQKLPLGDSGKPRATLKGDRYSVREGDRVHAEGSATIDPSKSPKHLDLMPTRGENEGKPQKAIYELKGDTLRICIAPPEKDRPNEFTSKEGRMLIVFKRVKS